jgi:hypothetical protein
LARRRTAIRLADSTELVVRVSCIGSPARCTMMIEP